jgi:hypothetical protein
MQRDHLAHLKRDPAMAVHAQVGHGDGIPGCAVAKLAPAARFRM